MSINYALYRNKLTGDTNLYAAKAIKTDSVGTDQIIDRIAQQGSTLTRPDISAVIQSVFTAIAQMLLEGKRVNFAGLCDFSCRIKGKFDGLEDRFDPERHLVDLAVSPGKKMRDIIRQDAHTSKQETELPSPYVFEYEDLASGTTNSFVTANNIGSVKGKNLSFNPTAEDEGIFFIDTNDNTRTKVQLVQRNKPSQLIFMTPDLPQASYRLGVASRYTPEGQLRAGQLNCLLTAESAVTAVA